MVDKITLEEGKLKSAVKWFVKKLRNLSKKGTTDDEVNIKKMKSFQQFSKKMRIGFIYVHAYDPKLKKTLPFYDRLPLWTPVKLLPDRMLGLNFHFLPPVKRTAFLNQYTRYLEETAFKYGYEDLNDVPPSQISLWGRDYISDVYLRAIKSPGNMLRTCVRTYLYSHIRSKLAPVKIDEWDNVANLVLPNFAKKSNSYIYKEMYNTYNKYKDSIRRDIYKA